MKANGLRKVLLSFGLGLPLVLTAGVEWVSRTYDFGVISEDGGKQEGGFRFVNTGESPVIVTRVKTSCGCTQADYDSTPVEPGDTASIRFAYDPYRRPGRFEKTIRVWLAESGKGEEGPASLTISGNVMPGEETLSNDYPTEGCGVRLQGKMVNLGELKRGVSRHGFLQVFNTSDKPLALRFANEEHALEVKQIPDTIWPGEAGILSFCLDTAKEPRVGDMRYRVRTWSTESPDTLTIQIWGLIN